MDIKRLISAYVEIEKDRIYITSKEYNILYGKPEFIPRFSLDKFMNVSVAKEWNSIYGRIKNMWVFKDEEIK